MTTVLKNIFFIALNWLLTIVWQDFVTVKKYRLVSIGNGQLSTRTRVILLWATPVGPRPNRVAPGIMPLSLSRQHRHKNNSCSLICIQSTAASPIATALISNIHIPFSYECNKLTVLLLHGLFIVVCDISCVWLAVAKFLLKNSWRWWRKITLKQLKMWLFCQKCT